MNFRFYHAVLAHQFEYEIWRDVTLILWIHAQTIRIVEFRYRACTKNYNILDFQSWKVKSVVGERLPKWRQRVEADPDHIKINYIYLKHTPLRIFEIFPIGEELLWIYDCDKFRSTLRRVAINNSHPPN